MSDRRYSLSKLSSRWRIFEEDLVVFLDKCGLQPESNSHGYYGYDPEKVQSVLDGLDVFSRNELFLLKARWEQEKEKNQPFDQDLSLDEVADLFGGSKRKVIQFLNSNNVSKVIKNGYTFYDARAVSRILNHPTKKQYVDLKRLRSEKVTSSHLVGSELAGLFEVPEDLVNRWKRVLKIEKVFPLTRSKVLDIVSGADYERKKERFLGRELKKESDRVQKDKAEREILVALKETLVPLNFSGELIDGVPADKMFSSTHASTLVGVSAQVFRRIVKSKNIVADSFYTNKYGQKIDLFSYKTIVSLKDDEDVVKSRLRSSRAREKNRNKVEALMGEKERILSVVKNNVVVDVPSRVRAPLSTIVYVGPTNSGKTYNSLNALYEEYEAYPEGRYVYAGPLRMLAFEVYLKMCEKFGEANVGFITGEEQINPSASLLATTVEMAPRSGTSLVLDEAHWVVEPSRGHNWTKLLAGAEYENFHVLTAKEALNVIQVLTQDSIYSEVKEYTRKTSIKFKGFINVNNIPERSAVVCFSRKTVFKVAQKIAQDTRLKVGVLYGALPLMVRDSQIRKFVDGDYDVIVTTDVIGHGINLPVDNVLYVETQKFDGRSSRPLHIWEAAQISGRAGRFGLSDEGSVYCLNLGWNDADDDIVRNSARAAAGEIGTGLLVDSALLAPSFSDFSCTQSDMLLSSLEEWLSQASLLDESLALSPSLMLEKIKLLEKISSHLSTPLYVWDKSKDERDYSEGLRFGEKKPLYPSGRALNDWGFKADILWQLVSGPFDPNLETVHVLASWLQGGQKSKIIEDFYMMEVADKINNYGCGLETLEKLSRIVSELKMVDVIFPHAGLDSVQLSLIEQDLGEKIIAVIDKGLTGNSFNQCVSCGGECVPWFTFCDTCYGSKKSLKVALSF